MDHMKNPAVSSPDAGYKYHAKIIDRFEDPEAHQRRYHQDRKSIRGCPRRAKMHKEKLIIGWSDSTMEEMHVYDVPVQQGVMLEPPNLRRPTPDANFRRYSARSD